MQERLDRMEAKLDAVLERVSDLRERQAKVETHQKGFFTIFSAVFAGLISYIVAVISGGRP